MSKLLQLEFKQVRFLNKINRWAKFQVVELTIECSPLFSLESIFPHHLKGAGLIEQFFLSLFDRIGCPCHFSMTHPIERHPNLFYVLVAYDELITAEKLIQLGQDILNQPQQPSTEIEKKLQAIQAEYEDIRMGPSTHHIVQAAIQKNIPYRRIATGSLVKLGYGCKQRFIQASLIDSTSTIADAMAQDKFITKQMLKIIGIPVPAGKIVQHRTSALYDADDIGYPIVIKPIDGNQGKGVTVNIQNEAELLAAFDQAKKYSEEVLIEQYIGGDDFRLLVVGDQLVAASQRLAPSVIGDGQKTIAELIDVLNQDPKRLDGHNGILSKIEIDQVLNATLQQQKLSLESIPQHHQKVILRHNTNLSTGGTAIDVTDIVHPSIALQAIEAAKLIGIDVCGIDVVCKDITKPLSESGGAFIELNLSPGLRMHLAPSVGQPRNIGDAIIKQLTQNHDFRIPIITITGTNGKTSTTEFLSKILQDYQMNVGMTSTNGIYFNSEELYSGDCSGPWSADKILSHPEVEIAVLETARGGLLRKGLGFDEAQVAIITSIGEADHLGIDYLYTPEDILSVKKTILRSVAANGYVILNADDELVRNLNQETQAHIIYFSLDAHNPILKAHLGNQGTIIYYDEKQSAIILKNATEQHEFQIDNIAYIFNQNTLFQIQNTMCALASIWALKLPMAPLKEILMQHKDFIPGRFKIYQHQDRTIIADYAHNMNALTSIMDVVKNIPAKKRLVLTSSAGDRQDDIIVKQMQYLGEHFDHGVIYQDLCQRNRQDGEVFQLIRKGFAHSPRLKTIDEIYHEKEAIEHIISITEPGDLCLLLIDDIGNSLSNIEEILQ